jgi:hypothetical protein
MLGLSSTSFDFPSPVDVCHLAFGAGIVGCNNGRLIECTHPHPTQDIFWLFLLPIIIKYIL